MARLDAAAEGHTADEVIAEEVRLIDKAFPRGVKQDGARGGRDLRLHVGGDVLTLAQAHLLGGAAQRWRDRDGGDVWTFTHTWRDIPSDAWSGAISALASVEQVDDVERARKLGYAAALTVDYFPSKKPYRLPGQTALFIPCPHDATKKTTCAECRLCLNADALYRKNSVIVFEAHGAGANSLRQYLSSQTGSLLRIRMSKDGVEVGEGSAVPGPMKPGSSDHG